MVMQIVDLELRERLVRYLRDEITLKDFYEWFTPCAWNVANRVERPTAELFHEIDLLLSEYSHGDWDEAEFKAHLAPFITTYIVRQSAAPSWSSTTTELSLARVVLVPDRSPVQTLVVGRRLARAS